ncbi:hypothetical protein BU14_0249s0008 [Porphyra umbilicalis]|uniref:Peptidase S54 rhomboid domain-containing protein n=1 Tax=Porphyra umbilicalis TaxID=2786 RepID=A0A1X6P2T1_PORUM|nr:hypothetical protein BU14_0249s0008 [Porphyra umbilicalis]|eukprot:OSX75189.1 hypothetical protein BU14_0249s0008 [Porphyra umbilicalis]
MMGEVGALARRGYVAVRGSAAPPPLFSSTVLVVLVGAHVASPLLSTGALCLRPSDLFARLQLYRLNTAPVLHANLLHLAVNALAWLSLAPAMEEAAGTGSFTHLIFSLLVPLIGVGAAAGAYAADAVLGAHGRLTGACTIGLSGVLFGMLVIHLRRAGVNTVDMCGCFVMPARWYPLALVGLIQLLAPGQVALGAHLAGIAVGEATVAGAWRWLTPPPSMIRSVEGARLCGCVPALADLPGYITCAASLAGAGLPTTVGEGGDRGGGGGGGATRGLPAPGRPCSGGWGWLPPPRAAGGGKRPATRPCRPRWRRRWWRWLPPRHRRPLWRHRPRWGGATRPPPSPTGVRGWPPRPTATGR